MIVVRNTFQLKFGKAKEARELWKDGNKLLQGTGVRGRMLADVTGNFYTFVLETEHASISDWESAFNNTVGAAEWGAWYQKFVPLVESGRREIFNVVEF